MRWFSDELFFPKFDPSRASIKEIVDLFLAGRGSAHAFMNWQTKEQLDVEFVLNARATSSTAPRSAPRGGRSPRATSCSASAPARDPDVPGLARPASTTSSTLVEDLDFEPDALRLVGGSKVAIEYGSFFHATGCDTTIVSRSEVMRSCRCTMSTTTCAVTSSTACARAGWSILEGADLLAVERRRRPVSGVGCGRRPGARPTGADLVFLGLGERPDTAALQETLGIEVGSTGRVLDDLRMQTGVHGVYAIGDLIGGPMEMWKARKSGMTAARNIMGEDLEFDYSHFPTSCTPPTR